MSRLKPIILILTALAMMTCGPILHAKGRVDISGIKAGLIYHLTKLVTWPDNRFESPDSPIVVGFLIDEKSGVADYFKHHAPSYEAQDRPLEVKVFNAPAPDAEEELIEKTGTELLRCHILFVSSDTEKTLRDIINFPVDQGTLLIGETVRFSESVGMISLVEKKKSINIVANLDNLETSALKVSARFLQHAQIITNDD